MKTKAFVADWKRKEVSEIQEFVQSSDVIGLVDVTGIGAKQMLTMRSSLRDVGVRLRMSRNRLLKLALAGASKNKKGVEQIVDVFEPRQIALLSSTASPFKVFQMLMESKGFQQLNISLKIEMEANLLSISKIKKKLLKNYVAP